MSIDNEVQLPSSAEAMQYSMKKGFRRTEESLKKGFRRAQEGAQEELKKGLRRALGGHLEATWRSEGHLKA